MWHWPGLSMEATAAFTALLCVLDGLQWTSCGCGAAVSSAPIRSQHWPTQRPARCWAVAMRARDGCKQEGKQRMFGRTWWSAEIARASENKPTSSFYSKTFFIWTDKWAWNKLFCLCLPVLTPTCIHLYWKWKLSFLNHEGRVDNIPSFFLLSRLQQGDQWSLLQTLLLLPDFTSKWKTRKNNCDTGSLRRKGRRQTARDLRCSSQMSNIIAGIPAEFSRSVNVLETSMGVAVISERGRKTVQKGAFYS